jgi:hypothetical protein
VQDCCLLAMKHSFYECQRIPVKRIINPSTIVVLPDVCEWIIIIVGFHWAIEGRIVACNSCHSIIYPF